MVVSRNLIASSSSFHKIWKRKLCILSRPQRINERIKRWKKWLPNCNQFVRFALVARVCLTPPETEVPVSKSPKGSQARKSTQVTATALVIILSQEQALGAKAKAVRAKVDLRKRKDFKMGHNTQINLSNGFSWNGCFVKFFIPSCVQTLCYEVHYKK